MQPQAPKQASRPPQFQAREPSAVPPRPATPRVYAPVRPAPEPEGNRTLLIVGIVVVLAGAFGMWRHFTKPPVVDTGVAVDPRVDRDLQAERKAMRDVYGEDIPPEAVLRARAHAEPAAAPSVPARTPAMVAYDQAKQSIVGGNLRRAVEHLKTAISHDSQFAEAWYQLGAAQTRLAIEAVNSDESLAVSLFEEAVASKKRARALISAGELRVWTPQQVDQVNADLEHALKDADAVMADRPSLIAALHLWAQSS